MTDKASQLVLELLSIRLRYSATDISRVRRVIEDRDPSLTETLDLIERISRKSPRKVRKIGEIFDPDGAREAFVAGLRDGRSSTARRKLQSIAQRLSIEPSRQPEEALIAEIDSRLKSMDTVELQEFLKRYKIRTGADEGYVGLAQFLIHREPR